MEALIRDTLAPVAPADHSHTVAANGRVEHDGDGYGLTLELTIEGDTAQRELAAVNCQELGRAAALVVAMAVNPGVAAVESESEADSPPLQKTRTPTQRAQPSTRRTSPPASEPKPEPRPQPDTKPKIGACGGVFVGLDQPGLPRLGAAIAGAVGLCERRYRVEAVGRYWFPQVVRARGVDAAMRLQAGAAGVSGCGVPRVGRFAFPLCAGVLAGGMRADGQGELDPSRSTTAPWIAFVPRVGFEPHLGGPVALAVRAGMYVALMRPAFHVDSVLSHRAHALGWSVDLGLHFE
jgi:hypothetical protein